MHFFRSEEHARRWCEERGHELGEILDLPTSWAFTLAYFGGRLVKDVPRRTPEQTSALLAEFGLTGPYWRL